MGSFTMMQRFHVRQGRVLNKFIVTLNLSRLGETPAMFYCIARRPNYSINTYTVNVYTAITSSFWYSLQITAESSKTGRKWKGL